MASTSARPIRYRIADAGDAIRRRETFVAGDGSLSGDRITDRSTYPLGRIDGNAYGDYAHAIDQHGAELYVVRSYGTPIAWAGPGEALTVPEVRYSVTTSRHQGIARRADDSTECTICGWPLTHRNGGGAGHRHTSDPAAATPAPW